MRRSAPTRAALFCAVLIVTPLLGQDYATTPAPSSDAKGTILDIGLSSDREGVTIAVTTDVPAVPETGKLEHPDRLVFDFPGFDLAGYSRRIPVNHPPVMAVRSSLFQSEPPRSRIVIDLKESVEPQLRFVGNTLLIELRFKKPVVETPRPESDRPSPPTKATESPDLKSQTAPVPAAITKKHSQGPSEYDLLSKAQALKLDDLKALEEKVQAGDPEAQTILALAYHSAVLLKNDEAEALGLLHKAADQGFMAAQESLGIFYATGIGMAQPNPAEALSWYSRAARQGSVDAATNLATMYATGDGVPRDMNAAIPWFRQAAESGGATAQYNLALIYGRGDGVQRDEQKFLDWLTKAANQDVIPALLDLAYRYMHPPDGSKPNIPAALQRYQKAAELGDARAQAILGDIYSGGTLVALDYPQAVKWYRMAADQGQMDGEFGLAARYVLGQGVAANTAEAFRWFKAAADQGHADAQFNIGRMYEMGQGTASDPSSAPHYYQMAAQQGVTKAQYFLGVLLTKGGGVASDWVSAYKWLLLAQDSVPDSTLVLNDLRKSMSAAEINDAEHQVNAWRSAHNSSRHD
jgi:TPR repeat protein